MARTEKPSFLGSVVDGGIGYAKGLLAGGAIGILAGAAIGGIIGLAGGALAAVGAAVTGAVILGSLFASIGSLAGTVTGVVKGREVESYSGQDLSKVAKVAFAQGVQVGQTMTPEQEQSNFRERIEAERAAAAQSQRIH